MKKARRGARLLVVEDDAANQEVALRILEHLGYDTVEVAADGKKALEALAAKDFDLVLMDCHLPGMDGYETSRQIRSRDSAVRNHDIPIVAATAAAMESDRRKCFAAGMNGYVTKPLRLDAMNRAIEQWTGGPQTASEPLAPGPVAAVGADRAPFDRNEFEELVMGNRGLARRIIRRFVDDMPRQIALLAQAVSDGDPQQVRLVAHSIKGAAASVSLPEMRAASWKLEQHGRDDNLADADASMVELSMSFERARPAIESYCQENPDER
jgi:CheY-like chemotaxis protein/HPt (histidine-containing phosphotransfer) domain-containing protein